MLMPRLDMRAKQNQNTSAISTNKQSARAHPESIIGSSRYQCLQPGQTLKVPRLPLENSSPFLIVKQRYSEKRPNIVKRTDTSSLIPSTLLSAIIQSLIKLTEGCLRLPAQIHTLEEGIA